MVKLSVLQYIINNILYIYSIVQQFRNKICTVFSKLIIIKLNEIEGKGRKEKIGFLKSIQVKKERKSYENNDKFPTKFGKNGRKGIERN